MMDGIYFLGGSPGSGKTTFTDAVYKNLGVAVYHTDDIFFTPDVTKDAQPNMFELRELSDPLDIWGRPPQTCLDFWVKYYEEAFGILMKNLRQEQAGSRPLIAEGVCVLPQFLERINCKSNVYFLISCRAFLGESISQKLNQIPVFSSKNKKQSIYDNMLDVFSAISQIMIEGCERANFPYLIIQSSKTYSILYQKILNQFSFLG